MDKRNTHVVEPVEEFDFEERERHADDEDKRPVLDETQCPPERFRDRSRKFASEWKDVVVLVAALFSIAGLLASTLASYIAIKNANRSFELNSSRYQIDIERWESERQRQRDQDDRSWQESRMDFVSSTLAGLMENAGRYKLLDPESLVLKNTSPDGRTFSQEMTLPICVKVEGDKNVPRFVLPRTHRIEERVTLVPDSANKDQMREQRYRVSVRLGPIRPSIIAPFDGVSWNTEERYDLFCDAKEFTHDCPELSVHGYLSVARAAHDFGEAKMAKRFLSLAIQAVRDESAPLLLSQELAEIAKTHLIMGNQKEGYELLTKCYNLLLNDRSQGQFNNVHWLMLWEAQFACTKGDVARAQFRLAEMASVIDGYDMSVSNASRLIEASHASCIAILADSEHFDPSLPVPTEFKIYDSQRGWESIATICQTAKFGESQLPQPMYWESTAVPSAATK